jgi:hypothetical protein
MTTLSDTSFERTPHILVWIKIQKLFENAVESHSFKF